MQGKLQVGVQLSLKLCFAVLDTNFSSNVFHTLPNLIATCWEVFIYLVQTCWEFFGLNELEVLMTTVKLEFISFIMRTGLEGEEN